MKPALYNRAGGRDLLLLALLALLPALAHAPAWGEGRLLGPGDGAALHYPLRSLVWLSYQRGEIPSWNGAIFSGTPLLSTYQAGAFYPLMPALALLPPFAAFQVLVLVSLGATAALTFLYLRRLGAGIPGAYVSGLCFSLGPYLVDHLGDTATLVATPALLLVMLAAESHMRRGSARRTAGLAAALALLLSAGSPEAVKAGAALLAGRLLLGHLRRQGPLGPTPWATALALGAALLLAAPQLLPTVLAAREAGPPAAVLAPVPATLREGITGLVLRYVSHTPAPSLALAALPLVFTQLPVRVLGAALGLCLVFQWGQAPLLGRGALALVFDLALAILAGLSLQAQWAARRDALGRRLRAYFLLASLASAAALSVAATVVGPLPQILAGSVGVLALALILYFALATSPDPMRASLFLLPLTVSFLLQPHGRQAWAGAPTRDEVDRGTPTREAIDRAMGPRRNERILTLVTDWPATAALDLAYANLSALAGRRTANGYDPFVTRARRLAFDDMSPGGTLPESFLRSDPARLRALGIRWVQAPTSALTSPPDAAGLGAPLNLALEGGRPRFFPLPITAVTEVRLSTSLADAVEVEQGVPVGRAVLRLPSGHELPLPVRAGLETAEWAHDRGDVRDRVRHERAPVLESFREPGWDFEGHRYRAALKLPGRYVVDGLRLERLPGPGRLVLWQLGLYDAARGRVTAVSLTSGYLSDTLFFREAAATPLVKLFEVRGTFGPARVVDNLRAQPDEAAVFETLRSPLRAGFDPRREALLTAAEAQEAELPLESRTSRAELVRAEGNRLDLRALGPGLLVVTEGWDPGWTAEVDGTASRIIQVNGIHMGVLLGEGAHSVALRHRARGLRGGLALAAVGAAGLLVSFRRRI